MAISDVAGATVSTAIASTQRSASAPQPLQTPAEGAGNTEPAQSVTPAASLGESSSEPTGDRPRGSLLDITV